MNFTRKIFEYGILAMALSCLMIFGLLFFSLFEHMMVLIVEFDLTNLVHFFQDRIQNENYSEVVLFLIWGFFFLGLIFVFFSMLLRLVSKLLFRTNLLKEVPNDIKVDPNDVAIVIPAYNEEETIEKVITECMNYSSHIIVVDDGSTDKTPELLKKFPTIDIITNEKNQGLGTTMKRGIEYATKKDVKSIVTFDADGQYRSSEIPKIVYFSLSAGADLVLGSRFAGKIEEMSLSKKLGNKMMSFALSLIMGLRITDGQTGFRGISKELALQYRLRGEYTYTQEMIIQAKFLGKKIIEIPIFFDKRISGSSRLISTPIDYAWKSWLTILRTLRDFQPIWFFGGFGIVAFLIGLFFFSITSVSSRVLLENFPFDITIFSTILMLVGVQFIFFGFLADAIKPI